MVIELDWSKFNLAMSSPNYQSGQPVFKDEPRMTVQAVVDNLEDMAPEEVAAMYKLPLRLVEGTKRFVESQSVVAHPL